MATIDLHPSELAYAFSYAQIRDVVGWGLDPFLPSGPADGTLSDWLAAGEDRLLAAGRLTGTRENGLNFAPDLTAEVLALVNPDIVLLAQRKVGEGMVRMTVHVAGNIHVGLMRRTDGQFEMTRYQDLLAGAGACAGFVGASLDEVDGALRFETDGATMAQVADLARSGRPDRAAMLLGQKGLSHPDAHALADALAAPVASGVVSVLYVRMNRITDSESHSVLTDRSNRSWVILAPAGEEGPTVVELSSASGLTARIAVGVMARTMPVE